MDRRGTDRDQNARGPRCHRRSYRVPARLDTSRVTGPFQDDKPGLNRSGFFADLNTSKYDIALNLKHPDAHAIAKRLVSWADVRGRELHAKRDGWASGSVTKTSCSGSPTSSC